jgi:hypothetical protein
VGGFVLCDGAAAVLYGFACGEVKKVLELDARAPDVTAVPGKDWRALETDDDTREYDWSFDRCEYVRSTVPDGG